MTEQSTELERCFVRYNAARAALEQATTRRKQVFTHHSPAWYAAVEAEAECFNETYAAHQDLKERLSASEAEVAARTNEAAWSLRLPVPAEAAATVA